METERKELHFSCVALKLFLLSDAPYSSALYSESCRSENRHKCLKLMFPVEFAYFFVQL
jgi:hypothetical protein